MKKAVIYARYSSDMQREESIDAQVRACTYYAHQYQFEILRTYADRAQTGKRTKNREQFLQMIADAESHEFEVILDNVPFQSTLQASISVTGYNFTFSLISTPRIIIENGETAGLYCKKVFEAAKETEDKFSEKLFSLHGQTPEWY